MCLHLSSPGVPTIRIRFRRVLSIGRLHHVYSAPSPTGEYFGPELGWLSLPGRRPGSELLPRRLRPYSRHLRRSRSSCGGEGLRWRAWRCGFAQGPVRDGQWPAELGQLPTYDLGVLVDAAAAARFLADTRLSKAMAAAAARVLPNPLDCEDALQATRSSLLVNLSARPRDIDNFAAYALASTTYSAIRIAKNNSKDDLRQLPEEAGHAVSDREAEDAIGSTDLRIALRDCLSQLQPRHRMALLMSVEGMTYREIGEHVNLSANSVGALLTKVRARMRQCLEKGRHG